MNSRKVCNVCLRPTTTCYCQSIVSSNCYSKILILRHFEEASHPFNTARMAKLGLPKNLVILDSNESKFNEILDLFIRENNPFLLFKNEKSEILTVDKVCLKNPSFIVLDGTWSKARKIFFKNKCLQELKVFHLNTMEDTIYKDLRRSCSPEHLSTIEAIKETLETVEDRDFSSLLEPLKEVIRQQSKWPK